MSKTCQVEKHSCSLLPCRQSRSFPGRELHDVSLQVARAMASDERRQILRGHIFRKHFWYIVYIHHRGPWWWKFYHSSQEPLDISAPSLRVQSVDVCHWSHVRNLQKSVQPGDVNNLPVTVKSKNLTWCTWRKYFLERLLPQCNQLMSRTFPPQPPQPPAMPMALAALISGLGFQEAPGVHPKLNPRIPGSKKLLIPGAYKIPIPTSALPIYEDSKIYPLKKTEKIKKSWKCFTSNTQEPSSFPTLFPPPGYLQNLGAPSVSAYLTITGSLKPWGMLPSRLSLIHFAWRPQPVTGTESRGPRLEDDDFPGIPK